MGARAAFCKDRRRRLRLGTELAAGVAAPPRPRRRTRRKADEAAPSGPRYFRQDVGDRGLRLTDLIPRHRLTVGLIGLVGYLAVLVLHLVAVPDLASTGLSATGERSLVGSEPSAFGPDPWQGTDFPASPLSKPALDANVDPLAAWWASTCFLGAAAVAGVIFSLRRLRVDDYRGRYRIWVWVAGLAAVSSCEISAHVVERTVLNFVASSAGGDVVSPASWSISSAIEIAFLVILAGMAARMAVEMVRSTPALVCLAVAVVFGLLGHVLELTPMVSWFSPGGHRHLALAERTVASWSLVFALVLYARHVLRDSLGADFDPAAMSRQERLQAELDAVLEAPEDEAETSAGWLGRLRRRPEDETRDAERAEPRPRATVPSTTRSEGTTDPRIRGERQDDTQPTRQTQPLRPSAEPTRSVGSGPLAARMPSTTPPASSPPTSPTSESESAPVARRGWFGLGRKQAEESPKPASAGTSNSPDPKPVKPTTAKPPVGDTANNSTVAEPKPKKGLLGFLRRGPKADQPAESSQPGGSNPSPASVRPSETSGHRGASSDDWSDADDDSDRRDRKAKKNRR